MELKVVTFNIRIQSASDFAARVDRISKRINDSSADIICFQELSTSMQKLLAEKTPDYVFVGGGRDATRLGEGTPIAYKRDRFVLQEFRTRWLSDKPTVPNSCFECDQGHPRIYTFALLSDHDTEKHFRIYNTHFDYRGKNARILESKMLRDEIAKDDEIFKGIPFVITGDFNAMPQTEEIKIISERDDLTDISSQIEQTFNGYDKPFDRDKELKIDYIFVSDGIVCTGTELWSEKVNGEYLSDHFPILSYLSF